MQVRAVTCKMVAARVVNPRVALPARSRTGRTHTTSRVVRDDRQITFPRTESMRKTLKFLLLA